MKLNVEMSLFDIFNRINDLHEKGDTGESAKLIGRVIEEVEAIEIMKNNLEKERDSLLWEVKKLREQLEKKDKNG